MSISALRASDNGGLEDMPKIVAHTIALKDNLIIASGVTKYTDLNLLGPDLDKHISAGDSSNEEIITGALEAIEAWQPQAIPGPPGPHFFIWAERRNEAFPVGAAVRIEGPFEIFWADGPEIGPQVFLTLTENPFTTKPYPPEGPGPEDKYFKLIRLTFGEEQESSYAKSKGYDSYEEYVKSANPAGGAA